MQFYAISIAKQDMKMRDISQLLIAKRMENAINFIFMYLFVRNFSVRHEYARERIIKCIAQVSHTHVSALFALQFHTHVLLPYKYTSITNIH